MIREFLLFLKLRRSLDIRAFTPELRHSLRNANSELEKKINEVLLYNLSRKMINGNIPGDFAIGFKTALMLRSSLMSTKQLKEED